MSVHDDGWLAVRDGLVRAAKGHAIRHRARLVAHLHRSAGSGLEVAREHARSIEGLLEVVFAGVVASTPGVVGLAERFFQLLWDVGLDVGHAVRGVEDTVALAATDVRTATMLLDRRGLGGDRALVEALDAAFARAWPAMTEQTLASLASEREARHHRYGDSPFLLEPELKHGCGGLRDLDVVRWSMASGPRPPTLDEAVERGVLVLHEAEEIGSARAFVWDVRQRLHARAGRRQDRLTFEDQEEIAAALGEHDEPGMLGVERFMQRYYRAARSGEQASERALARGRAANGEAAPDAHVLRELAQDPDLALCDGRLGFSVRALEDARLRAEHGLPLRFYRLVESLAIAPDPKAREAIARAMRHDDARAALRAADSSGEALLEMLAWIGDAPVKRGSILAELHDVGVLLAMIPEFEPVTGRVQHDVYHVYTVDVHSIAAVDRLRALLRGELAEELPVATRVATEVTDRRRLALAVLLHDVGKGRGKDHSIHGAELAVPICARLGLGADDTEHVRWLVREHLHLYHWATRRDTSDPETLTEIARAIGSIERLRDLYLLTLVDLATTNPKALTPWKARLFDDLYLDLAGVLEGDAMPSQTHRMLEALEARGADAALALLTTLPDRYALGVDLDTVLAHAAVVEARGERAVHVAQRAGFLPEIAELVVVADDRPGLLADIAAVLAAHRLSVTTASIHTRLRPDGRAEALDVFVVRSAAIGAEGPPVDASKLAGIARDLERVMAGAIDGHALLAARPTPPSWARRRSPEVRTEIVIDNAASPHFTVLDVFTRDREGLLHAIAHALHSLRLSIVLAKVSTEGERVTDAFYVSEVDGRKIEGVARVAEVRDAVREAIGSQEEPSRRQG